MSTGYPYLSACKSLPGDVISSDHVHIPTDPHRLRPAGHALVTLCSVLEARRAISELSMKEMHGFRVSIRYANQQQSPADKRETAETKSLPIEGKLNKRSGRSFAARSRRSLKRQARRDRRGSGHLP